MSFLTSRRALIPLAAAVLALALTPLLAQETEEPAEPAPPALLTDPFLQLPTEDGVHVVWFTEWEGQSHTVTVNGGEPVAAATIQLSRTAEDGQSRVGEQVENEQVYERYTPRSIWRHEAYIEGLTAGERVPYFVTSIADDGTEVVSETYTLAPLPEAGQPLRILLTSDHQLRDMTPANLQIVEETVGVLDAVFFSGDLVNIPDRASEWFDDNRGFAFFPGLQGNANVTLTRTQQREDVTFTSTRTYTGGEIIQHAPLFPVVGNHEVMGRYNPGNSTGAQYNDPQPRWYAEQRYETLAELVNPTGDPAIREQWIMDNSFNSITYEEIFTLPDDGPAGEQYWAMQFGDVYVIGLYSTRIWRTPGLGDDARGKYREPLAVLNVPEMWGFGDFIFEDLAEGSPQYEWLVEQLNSEAFQNSAYQVVIMHQGAHGLGDNYNPVFAHPQQVIDYAEDGRIEAVRYEYPIEDDILVRDLDPLFVEAGVDLIHQGHSHLWFHLNNQGVDILETSNVGNSFGCYLEGYRERGNVPNDPRYNAANYAATGDPHGLEPIPPSEFAPQQDENGNDLPCVASNDFTVFSILDTGAGTVSSYVFDTRDPLSEPQIFDVFAIGE
jgi:hypothetical protein